MRQVVVVGAEEVELVRDIVVAAGYGVLVHPTLAAAEALVRTLPAPALFLLDEPPQAGLRGFLAALHKHRSGELDELPVVLLTRKAPRVLTGIREVVSKPCVPALLLEVIQRLFERI